jgi:hypothetical protein
MQRVCSRRTRRSGGRGSPRTTPNFSSWGVLLRHLLSSLKPTAADASAPPPMPPPVARASRPAVPPASQVSLAFAAWGYSLVLCAGEQVASCSSDAMRAGAAQATIFATGGDPPGAATSAPGGAAAVAFAQPAAGGSRKRRGSRAVTPEPGVAAATHAPDASGIAEPTPTPGQTTEALRQQMVAGLVCGVCRGELKAGAAKLECTSLRPDCQREYHPECVVGPQFGRLYRASEVAVPQPRDSKWRCMVCADVCAVCVPAAKIVAHEPFYRCGYCGAKAHQRHWHAGEDKICFFCHLRM